MVERKAKVVWEFGDFQTPESLASDAVEVIKRLGFFPQSVVEPTCGRGSFLLAAVRTFNLAKKFLGVEINKAHINYLQEKLSKEALGASITILHADFFTLDWSQVLRELPQPILVIGNPPWVTNTELAKLESSNLPDKSNFQDHRGFDAITGKSNFDISEWMLLQYLQWLKERNGFVAVLCKTAVARKILVHAWKHNLRLTSSKIYLIDAIKHFSASVDACFFVMEFGDRKSLHCYVYDTLYRTTPSRIIGYHDGTIIADVEMYKKWHHLRGIDPVYTWRSGIKHDCAKVLELELKGKTFYNKQGVAVNIEDIYVYPMYKSSDIGNGNILRHRKYMLVTQKYIGEETSHIEKHAAKTWRYLKSYEEDFLRRRSSIYRNRPPFSIFGVGDYTFAPWKVAISGFYKNLNFKCIAPVKDRPAIFDDTVYFLPCWSEQEAIFLTDILNSQPAQEFLHSMIFWRDKRPITVDLLKRLNLHVLSVELGRETEYLEFASQRKSFRDAMSSAQLSLGISENKQQVRRRVSNGAIERTEKAMRLTRE